MVYLSPNWTTCAAPARDAPCRGCSRPGGMIGPVCCTVHARKVAARSGSNSLVSALAHRGNATDAATPAPTLERRNSRRDKRSAEIPACVLSEVAMASPNIDSNTSIFEKAWTHSTTVFQASPGAIASPRRPRGHERRTSSRSAWQAGTPGRCNWDCRQWRSRLRWTRSSRGH